MPKQKKLKFSKCIVITCVIIAGIITAAAIILRLETGLTATLLGFWGGELLLVCLKCITGDKNKAQSIDYENYEPQI